MKLPKKFKFKLGEGAMCKTHKMYYEAEQDGNGYVVSWVDTFGDPGQTYYEWYMVQNNVDTKIWEILPETFKDTFTNMETSIAEIEMAITPPRKTTSVEVDIDYGDMWKRVASFCDNTGSAVTIFGEGNFEVFHGEEFPVFASSDEELVALMCAIETVQRFTRRG